MKEEHKILRIGKPSPLAMRIFAIGAGLDLEKIAELSVKHEDINTPEAQEDMVDMLKHIYENDE